MLSAISPLSTGYALSNPLGATRGEVHKERVIGTEVPSSFGRKGRKVRSPPAGDEEKLRLRIGPAGRGAGRASLSCAKRGVPRDAGDAKGDWSKKGRGRKRNPSSDWDPRPEATPELVSQDRGAGDLRVAKADEHRRILRSAQMGAGSNAGPHFSLGLRQAHGGWLKTNCWQPDFLPGEHLSYLPFWQERVAMSAQGDRTAPPARHERGAVAAGGLARLAPERGAGLG